jgi:hypothetical protein
VSNSYIIRFPDEHSRAEFQEALETAGIAAGHVQFGSFLPDAVVQDVSDQDLEAIRKIVDPQAEFFEDVQFYLPAPKT